PDSPVKIQFVAVYKPTVAIANPESAKNCRPAPPPATTKTQVPARAAPTLSETVREGQTEKSRRSHGKPRGNPGGSPEEAQKKRRGSPWDVLRKPSRRPLRELNPRPHSGASTLIRGHRRDTPDERRRGHPGSAWPRAHRVRGGGRSNLVARAHTTVLRRP